jgi:hypothetical protein
MISISNFHLKNLLQTSKTKNINLLKSKFFKNFTIYQKYVNNNSMVEKEVKESPIQNEQKVILNPNSKFSIEFSKTIFDLKDEINGTHIQHKDYNKLYTIITEIFNSFQKNRDRESYELIFREILPFLERHLQRFKTEQMIKMVCLLAESDIGHLQYFRVFQYYIGKALEKQKNHLSFHIEDVKLTKLLFQYFTQTAEISMMESVPLNFVLEYFANYSSSLLGKNAEPQTLYDFMWLTSISIASILVKKISCPEFEPYVNNNSKVLNEKGALGFKKILNHLDKIVKNDTNFSENLLGKVRLYKSLYYLKLEGIELPKNLEEFLTKFAPFHKMNVERSISGSVLEDNFENVLRKLGLKYEKEKKLNFCSVDFFVEPDYCIEINGPTHYVFSNRPKDAKPAEYEVNDFPIGKDLLKRRVLQLERYDYVEFSYNELIHNPTSVLETLQTRYGHLKDEKFANEVNILKNERQIFVSEKKDEAKKKSIIQRVKDSHYLI